MCKKVTSIAVGFVFLAGVFTTSQAESSVPLIEKVSSILGVSDPIAIGTSKFNQAAFKSLEPIGERKELLEVIVSRAVDLGLGVELSYFGSHALLHWTKLEEGFVVRVDVQMVFDEKLRLKNLTTALERHAVPLQPAGVDVSTTPLVDPRTKK
jgi:hypothetical protein